jgi:hypothetical protein
MFDEIIQTQVMVTTLNPRAQFNQHRLMIDAAADFATINEKRFTLPL